MPARPGDPQQDSPDTLFFCDPPYVHATRSALAHKGGPNDCCYRHEMSDDDHRALLLQLRDVAGMVVLSGYDNAIYRDLIPDWDLQQFASRADGGIDRTECVWRNPAALRAGRPLFSAACG